MTARSRWCVTVVKPTNGLRRWHSSLGLVHVSFHRRLLPPRCIPRPQFFIFVIARLSVLSALLLLLPPPKPSFLGAARNLFAVYAPAFRDRRRRPLQPSLSSAVDARNHPSDVSADIAVTRNLYVSSSNALAVMRQTGERTARKRTAVEYLLDIRDILSGGSMKSARTLPICAKCSADVHWRLGQMRKMEWKGQGWKSGRPYPESSFAKSLRRLDVARGPLRAHLKSAS